MPAMRATVTPALLASAGGRADAVRFCGEVRRLRPDIVFGAAGTVVNGVAATVNFDHIKRHYY